MECKERFLGENEKRFLTNISLIHQALDGATFECDVRS